MTEDKVAHRVKSVKYDYLFNNNLLAVIFKAIKNSVTKCSQISDLQMLII